MIRVVHLPARTPYARKLVGPGLSIVNGSRVGSGVVVPRDASFGWLARQASFDFFDVLHIHSVELAAGDDIDAVLDRCKAAGKRVISTVHDVYPMFGQDHGGYAATLRKLTSRGVPLVTLTAGAASFLAETLDLEEPPLVLPHGYVLHPDDDRWADTAAGGFRYAMYGGFRPNRVMYPVIANALFGTEPSNRLGILTRALSPIELRECQDARDTIAAALARPDRLEVRLRPFPDNNEIVDFLVDTHSLVMPYLWGTHSGQLELAFDLGVVPVISDVGFFREQWLTHQDLIPEPVWFDWRTGSEYGFGSPLLDALLTAANTDQQLSDARARFRGMRREEHDHIVDTYRRLYFGQPA